MSPITRAVVEGRMSPRSEETAGFPLKLLRFGGFRSQNVLALLASLGLALAFVLKDYGSSLMAGLVTVFEQPYQVGGWITLEGTYGEVRSIGLLAVHLVTPDDTEVVIPHSKLRTSSLFNATAGQRHLLCTADFHLQPEHDGALAQAPAVAVEG